MTTVNNWYFESPSRYYCVTIQKDLFDEWVLTKHWGGLNNNIYGSKTEVIRDIESIDKRISDILKLRKKKNYRLIEK